MDELRLLAVVARVAAWHNRHLLARRIKARQVHSVGYVALPFSAPALPGAVEPALDAAPAEAPEAATLSLRERAQARSRHLQNTELPVLRDAVEAPLPPKGSWFKRAQLEPAFDEDFLAPLKPRQVARWVRRHGRVLLQPPQDGPVRQAQALPLQPGQRRVMVYAMTAAVQVGTRKRRLLLGAGDVPAVLGPRLWSLPRAASLVLGTAVLGLALHVGLPRLAGDGATQIAAAPAPAPAASAPQLQIPPEPPAPEPPVVETPAQAAQQHAAQTDGAVAQPAAPPASSAPLQVAALAHQPAPAASASLPTEPPRDVEPRLGRVELPPLPLPDDGAKAAARALRQQRQPERVAAPASAPAPAAASAATTVAAAPALPRGAPAFALSTRLVRTRAEAEQMATAMSALLQARNAAVRVEVLPQGDDWRVVGWPFAAAAQADAARTQLAARGVRVAVVDF